MNHRARFKIPDLPADRPKCPEVAALIRAYYEKPGNGAGGNCHLVLDDGNLENGFIEICLEQCKADGDEDGEAIMAKMLQMSPSQKRRLRR